MTNKSNFETQMDFSAWQLNILYLKRSLLQYNILIRCFKQIQLILRHVI